MWDSIYKGIDDIIYDNIDNKMIENLQKKEKKLLINDQIIDLYS